MAEAGAEPTLRGYVRVLSRGHWWTAACTLAGLRRTRDELAQAGVHVIGAVLNKATAQDGYGYYSDSYQPDVPPDLNAHPLPVGQPRQNQN
jgi:hypothetical protein